MRKPALIIGLGLIILVALLATSLIWSEDTKVCPKSKMSQAATIGQPCAKAEQCQMSQNPPSDQLPQAGCQMMGQGGMMPMGCQTMGGQMSQGGMMPMGCRMSRPKMMAGMDPIKMKQPGHPVEKALRRLGCPDFLLGRAEDLSLTDQQVDELKSIINEHHKWHIRRRADIEVAQVELEELLDQDPVNFDKVKAKISQIGDMEKEMLQSRLTVIQKAHQVLTAKQMEKVKDLKKDRAGRMGKGPRQVVKEVLIEEKTE